MDHRFFESRAAVIRCYRPSLCRIISAHSALVILVALGFVSIRFTRACRLNDPSIHRRSNVLQTEAVLLYDAARSAPPYGSKSWREKHPTSHVGKRERSFRKSERVLYGVRWDQNDGAIR